MDHSSFSSTMLAQNLSKIKYWNLPNLTTLNFHVEETPMGEHFYFCMEFVFLIIPRSAEKSLKKLVIRTPTFLSRSKNHGDRNQDAFTSHPKLQLHHIEVRLESFTFVPTGFQEFLRTQKNLRAFILHCNDFYMTSSVREVMANNQATLKYVKLTSDIGIESSFSNGTGIQLFST